MDITDVSFSTILSMKENLRFGYLKYYFGMDLKVFELWTNYSSLQYVTERGQLNGTVRKY